jgi:arginase
MTRYAIIEAPSILGLKPTGVERLPAVLLQHGLADELHARRAGRVEPQAAYDPERDPATLTLNAHGIADYSVQLANTVADVVGRGEFPILLGGDCSILLGSSLALRRRGRYGLLFLDGHADFYQPDATNGEAASMDLAFATGHGPELLTNLEGRGRWCETKTWSHSAFAMGMSSVNTAVSRCHRNCWLWT